MLTQLLLFILMVLLANGESASLCVLDCDIWHIEHVLVKCKLPSLVIYIRAREPVVYWVATANKIEREESMGIGLR